MRPDGVDDGGRAPVVEHVRLRAQSPERLGAHQTAGGLVLRDAVAERTHVVEQEVREGVGDLVQGRYRLAPVRSVWTWQSRQPKWSLRRRCRTRSGSYGARTPALPGTS